MFRSKMSFFLFAFRFIAHSPNFCFPVDNLNCVDSFQRLLSFILRIFSNWAKKISEKFCFNQFSLFFIFVSINITSQNFWFNFLFVSLTHRSNVCSSLFSFYFHALLLLSLLSICVCVTVKMCCQLINKTNTIKHSCSFCNLFQLSKDLKSKQTIFSLQK